MPRRFRLNVTATGTDDPRVFVGVEKWSDGAPVPFEVSYEYGRDRVAGGRLRLALRELDPDLSTAHQPEHSYLTLQPLRPGEPIETVIPLTSSSTLFRAGDSRRLTAGCYLEPPNPAFGHFPTHYIGSRSGKLTVN